MVNWVIKSCQKRIGMTLRIDTKMLLSWLRRTLSHLSLRNLWSVKYSIWAWFIRLCGVEIGQYLPNYLAFTYAIVFPLKYLRWKGTTIEGYMWERDVWVIHGVEYTDVLFQQLAKVKMEHKNEVQNLVNLDSENKLDDWCDY